MMSIIAFNYSCNEANLREGLLDGAGHDQELRLVGDVALHQVLHITTHDAIRASDRIRVTTAQDHSVTLGFTVWG